MCRSRSRYHFPLPPSWSVAAAGWLRRLLVLAVVMPLTLHAILGGPERVRERPAPGAVGLAQGGHAAPLRVAPQDWPGVARAARDVQADLERVTAVAPALLAAPPGQAEAVVLIGTLGRSPLLDQLVQEGRLDVAAIRGRWEAFLWQTVERPWPGVARALVIAGSDKRGTIYGLYELSAQAGVSPWAWWADVPVARRAALFVAAGRWIEPGPAVRYRGLFLNDEAPALTGWIRAKFGEAAVRTDPPVPAGVANYGREFYGRLFALMLRLRANYLWPAMWNNAFNEDDPENARLADEYGIVMGTSHQEPMLRAQKEWDRRHHATLGAWNYARHPEVLENFWREGIRRNRAYESLITLGLRGADDTEMAPGGPAANRRLLEHIVDRQRDILRAERDPEVTRIPQLWCLYKEVQEYYEHGMRVPDDVTLLWAEDNWGNLRRLPTADERRRAGGAGIYYHFDYHGGPRSYQWQNTSPLPKLWEQLSLARRYGADRIWIVNAGHFKGYEFPLEFFLTYAWAPERWTADDLEDYTRRWAAREFGPAHAAEIAEIVARCTKYHGRRKPELLAPDTYSLVNYREAETVAADWRAIADRAQALAAALPAEARDAFYQLVLFPVRAGATLHELYLAAGRNALYAQQGRASAADWARETRAAFARYLAMKDHFNRSLAGGKWAHFMDQPVLGYTTWRDPPVDSLDHLTLREPAVPAAAALGVAVEGAAAAWPGSDGAPQLPEFDALQAQRQYLEVFNRGREPLAFAVAADAPWIRLSRTAGTCGPDQRVWVEIDWARAPEGRTGGVLTVSGAGAQVAVAVVAFKPPGVTRATLTGFAESQGCVSIEPEHFTRNLPAGANTWRRLPDYGRTLSGMRAEGPVDGPSATPGRDAPCLEYRVRLFSPRPVEVVAITAPTLNFMPGRGLRYAVSIDDEPPQIVTLVPAGYQANHSNKAWEQSVAANAHVGRSRHVIDGPGDHTVKLWMVDPAVVLQKLVLDLGGVRPSYLGPPESVRGAAKPVDLTVGAGLGLAPASKSLIPSSSP